jgi:hypothetical protein
VNTVTQEQVDSSIVEKEIKTIELVGKNHCLVAVKLKNGFTIIETSTCVDPENYSEDIGAEICMKKIIDKIWMLEGYKLSSDLNDSSIGKFREDDGFQFVPKDKVEEYDQLLEDLENVDSCSDEYYDLCDKIESFRAEHCTSFEGDFFDQDVKLA